MKDGEEEDGIEIPEFLNIIYNEYEWNYINIPVLLRINLFSFLNNNLLTSLTASFFTDPSPHFFPRPTC